MAPSSFLKLNSKTLASALVLLVSGLAVGMFFLIATENSYGASYTYNGVSSGFSGASCSGAASDWVVVRAYLKDANTQNSISGSFTAQCKYDFRASSFSFATGCIGSNSSGPYYCEGPDSVHPGWSRFGAKCAGGSASSGSGRCMGACVLPFNLSATAPGYNNTPVWLVNHGVGETAGTLYPEGNANTANYSIYLNPSCTNECSTSGATRCLNSGTRQTCGNYDADACREWGNNTSCGTDRCSGTNWIDYKCASNVCTSTTTADCSAWTNNVCGGGSCSIGQMRQTRSCANSCGATSRCVSSSSCGGRIIGRVFVDDDADGTYDTGERFVQNGVSCSTSLSFTVPGTSVSYSGPAAGSENPRQCNPNPYYVTAILPSGSYAVNVNAPTGWTATTPTQTVNLSGGNYADRWFGIAIKPIAEASGAKTTAGPWADKVTITDINPDVDKSKNWDFVLSALQDITGDGRASRDPKGGPITCTWAYDIDNIPGTTFTGCELGDSEYTDAKRQEMVDYYKAKPLGTYGAFLTVTDSFGLTDTDTVTILKDPPPPPPSVDLFVVDDQCGTGVNLGQAINVITWSASGTTSYELIACIDTDCTTIASGPFTGNPNTFSHFAEDGVTYSYLLVVHGPGGDTTASTLIAARNCKGTIALTIYLVDDNGIIFFPIPGATVKLTNPSGTTVLATTLSDDLGQAIFRKLIPGTYGVLAYKDKFTGIAKQAGDCDTAQYSIANASIGPNATTEGFQAAWDNNVPATEGRTTFCYDLGLAGIPPLTAVCSASPDPAEVNTQVTWTADVEGGERAEKTYSYSWAGDDGLSGTGKTITKTYSTTGIKTALATVTSDGETSTELCAIICVNDKLVFSRFEIDLSLPNSRYIITFPATRYYYSSPEFIYSDET